VFLVQNTLFRIPERGRPLLNQLEKEAIRQDNVYTQCFVKAKMVQFYYYQYDTDSIFIAADDGIEFARKHKVHQQLFYIYQLLMQRHSLQGEFAKAAKIGQELLNEAKNLNDYRGMALATAGMANVYNSMGITDEALKYYKESISLLNKCKDPLDVLYLDLYNMIMYEYHAKEDFENIIVYADTLQMKIDEIYTANKPANLLDYRFSVECKRASAYLWENDTENAWRHIVKADSLYNLKVTPYHTYGLNTLKYNYYFERKEYKKALAYSGAAIKYIKDSDLKDMQFARHYAGHAHNLLMLERYKEAATVYEEATQLMKENYDNDINMQINQLRIMYDLDKLELQAEKDKLQLNIIHNRLIVFIIATVLLLAIVTIVIHNMRRIRRKNIRLVQCIHEQDILEEELEKQREELDRLRLFQASQKVENPEYFEEDRLITKLRKLLKDNHMFTDPSINRKRLAEMLGTNENYLRTIIKDKFGYTVNEYINDHRLNYAKKLLVLPVKEYTIEVIATECGFGTRSTLHRQFKAKYGLTPDEYRKLINNI